MEVCVQGAFRWPQLTERLPRAGLALCPVSTLSAGSVRAGWRTCACLPPPSPARLSVSSLGTLELRTSQPSQLSKWYVRLSPLATLLHMLVGSCPVP